MKRFLILLAAVATLAVSGSVTANAQSFGITAGLTSSSTDVNHFDSKSVSLYHAGVVFEIPLGMGFALQPGLTYQMKGATLDQYVEGTETLGKSLETEVGYLEVPLQLQWGPDLFLFRPFVFAEPFVGYGLASSNNVTYETIVNETERNAWKDNALKRLEYGIGFGVGIDFWQIQLSAQYFMNMGGLSDGTQEVTGDDVNNAIKNIMNTAYDQKNFSGIKFSAVLFF